MHFHANNNAQQLSIKQLQETLKVQRKTFFPELCQNADTEKGLFLWYYFDLKPLILLKVLKPVRHFSFESQSRMRKENIHWTLHDEKCE